MTTTEKPMLTVNEAAILLGVSPSMVRKLTKVGRLPVVRVMSSCRYLRADIDAFIEANRKLAEAGK